MIDIHTHILPHLDDGAKDTEHALAILRMEAEQGVDEVVFTPHFYGKHRSPEQFLEKRNAAYARLQDKFPTELKTRLGAEVHFTGRNMPENDVLCRLAIEGTKYILIEFPFTTAWTGELLDKLNDFILDTGYTPIIAHVERYSEVQKKPALVSELVHMGCLIQVNVGSFLDKREKKLAFAILKHGFVHCLGSDTHDPISRKPNWLEAKAAVENAGYLSEWERAEEIMRSVLANEEVVPEMGAPIKRIFGFYR